MPRLLHIITGLTTGGAERSLHNLLANGLEDYCENHVISLTGRDDFGPRIAQLGVPVHALGLKSGNNPILAMYNLRMLVKNLSPQIIQGWMYHGNLASRLSRILAPQRSILAWNIRQSLYNISDEKLGTQAVISAGRLLSRSPQAIIYNSEVARHQHELLGYSKKHGQTIPNGFDTDLWKPSREAKERTRWMLGLEEDAILVGFVARFHPMKDLASLLKAASILMSENPKVHLMVVGRDNGRDEPTLSPIYSRLPSDRLHIMGQIEDIPSIMPGIDLLCSPSAWGEGFPNVLGEAMSCGVTCVATDVGDSRQVVGETGCIVPASDLHALHKSLSIMTSLSSLERMQLGNLARSRIKLHYGLSTTVEHYTSLYEKMLKGH